MSWDWDTVEEYSKRVIYVGAAFLLVTLLVFIGAGAWCAILEGCAFFTRHG